MDLSSLTTLSPVPFYGLQSKKRNLKIKHTLENCSKRLKDQKIPSLYHSRILGPSSCWQIFYRQQEALDFARQNTEDLHVFAFECQQPGKQSGQRQFLTATYEVFWHYYMQLDESKRHHYEVIPEGHPCKLYFDLEFHKPSNPAVDGDVKVDILIKYVSCWLKELYSIQCSRNKVLELSASTETKFSRHLIFQLEGSMFKDNVIAGDFIRAVFGVLEDHLYGLMEHRDGTKHFIKPSPSHYKTLEEEQTQITEQKAVFILPQAPTSGQESEEEMKSRGVCGDFHEDRDTAGCNADMEMDRKMKTAEPHFPEEWNTRRELTGSETFVCEHCTGEQMERSVYHTSLPKDPSPVNNSTTRDNPVGYTTHRKEAYPDSAYPDSDKRETVTVTCSGHSTHPRNNACEWNSVSQGQETLLGTQSVPVKDLTQSVPVQDLTQSVPVQDLTQSVPVQDLTQSVPVKDFTQSVPVQDLTQSVPVQDLTQSVPVQDFTQSVPVQDFTQSVPVQDFTQSVPVQDFTQSVPVQDFTQSVPVQDAVSNKVSWGETGAGGNAAHSAGRDGTVSRETVARLCDSVFQQFEADELPSLFVKDKDGRDACFADLGVYTKNRNFRLYKSCKLGKNVAFTVAEKNTFTVKGKSNSSQKDREIFLASLITNTRGNERLLTFGVRANDTQPPPRHGQRRTALSHGKADNIEGYGKSPYPEVDDFIISQVHEQGGAVRRWTYFPSAEILSYDIINYRFCHNVQRQHRSNNIKLVADLQKGVWYQKCYDPDCQAVNFKSEEFALPSGILPANYFTDEFEDLDVSNMDEDDELCILALQDVERGSASTASPS